MKIRIARSGSTGSATAYGAGGSVTAYSSGTTTTYGSQTTYVPITVHRSDYGALFFIKRRFTLGAFTRDLNDSERQEHQTNKGVVVRLVADNTPAFDADILVGDVVTAIDGVSVQNSDSFRDLQREKRGKQALISILRRGQRLEKIVHLNP
jgi:membrane-associated protease RseP (regulator of RpoE activity)